MKKLLSILGTITIVGSGMTGLVGNSPAPTKKEINYLQTNNLKRLSRNKRALGLDSIGITTSSIGINTETLPNLSPTPSVSTGDVVNHIINTPNSKSQAAYNITGAVSNTASAVNSATNAALSGVTIANSIAIKDAQVKYWDAQTDISKVQLEFIKKDNKIKEEINNINCDKAKKELEFFEKNNKIKEEINNININQVNKSKENITFQVERLKTKIKILEDKNNKLENENSSENELKIEKIEEKIDKFWLEITNYLRLSITTNT
ncbi:hypothetical protein [Spiroplasma endosymbiont of Asaphidion curtum]|uniref:hypothetical protein n=1 Tax=Spiroplasma endosymbiont of Asaphidion curtum TaxID=3066281 RepID=UPI00313D34CB